MNKLMMLIGLMAVVFGFQNNAQAHCEVPCGIYDDEARVREIHEHVSTIEKAMKKIEELSAAEVLNHNQIVRWVNTKDEHAEEIQDITHQYFMTQRIKPVAMGGDEAAYKKYIHELTLLHNILVSAMKSKQTLDPAHPKAIHDYLVEFDASYFGKTAVDLQKTAAAG